MTKFATIILVKNVLNRTVIYPASTERFLKQPKVVGKAISNRCAKPTTDFRAILRENERWCSLDLNLEMSSILTLHARQILTWEPCGSST